MDVKDITPENVAKAVGGTVERDGSILCCCPVHEASGTHNPSLVLTVTDTRRIIFHCRSQNCDAKGFQVIRDHLVECGLPRAHVGGDRADKENRYTYQHPDGSYAWTKTRFATKAGKKRFRCEVFDKTTQQWSSGRPEGMPLLFNQAAVATVLAAYPEQPLLVVEGEKDVNTAGGLGVLATTNADGAGNWRVEDTQTLVKLGARKIVVCPDNDGPGIDHGIMVAKTFQQAGGIEVRWLELPELGPKEDLSDWAPKQVQPDALLVELIAAAPLFDAETLDWRSKLKAAGRNAGYAYRGDIHNMLLALRYEPRLKGCFAWNDFRFRVEVIRKTPWCVEEWWGSSSLTPVGNRALHDADMAKLGSYLTSTYDFGPCPMQACRNAIHAEAEDNIFDEMKDWIGALPGWNSVKILDGLMMNYMGADPQAHSAEYLALVGSKYIMQVLNRALNPGAKADYSWVFTALQGIGKDRVLEALFSPYYREGIPPPGINQADFARGISGAIVAHAAEMSAWRKADVDERKATLTRCVDHGRPAYGYETKSYPRRTSFVFTLNETEFILDATGDRRFWPISTIRERVDVEGLRRDRDQIFAEALHRLNAGELHWPTWEEEERLIAPERRKHMAEAALEVIAALARFITEEPLSTRPNRGDFEWKWQRRAQPLRELYLDAFFEKCFGSYAAVKRQGLDRASKKDVEYCTTWLRENGWRRIRKHLSDGQRLMVWCAPDDLAPSPSSATQASETRSPAVEAAAVAEGNMADVAGAAGHGPPTAAAAAIATATELTGYQQLTSFSAWATQNTSINDTPSTISSEEGIKYFCSVSVCGKSCLGGPSFEALLPATLDDLEEAFPRDRFLALDMETSGLSSTRDGVRTVQLSDGESAAMVIFDRPVPARALVVLADFLRGRRVVVHNARFEDSWLQPAGIDLVLDDTALLFAAVRGTRLPKGTKGGDGGRVSLAALAAMVLNEPLDKSEQTSDWSAPVLSSAQLDYALNDPIVTHRIWETLRAELHRKRHQHGVDIATGYEDLRFSAAMARRMERAGVDFDVAAHQAWIARKQEPVTAIEAHLAIIDPALSHACIASGVQLDRLFRQRLESYPDRAWQPVLRGWPKTEKTRRLSFGREELSAVLTTCRLQPAERKLIEALYARAEEARYLTTFGAGFSSHVVDGRLYGKFHAGGAVTGRYTSTDPNLQNIPTQGGFRDFFRAPEGRALVDVDYSQLELRVFATLSGDARMTAAFEDGWDYHDLIVQRVGCTRRQAKVINFGIIYGMGLATLAEELGVDEMTAGQYLRGWEEQAPTGSAWRSSLPRLYAAEQGVRTARRWIDYLDDDDADAAANTRPMNYPVQGGAADVMHRAMRLLFERYRDWPGNVLPVLTVHDEILVEVDVVFVDQVGSLLSEVMIEAYREVFPNGPIRFLAIPGIGATWAAAKADGGIREKSARASFFASRQPADQEEQT